MSEMITDSKGRTIEVQEVVGRRLAKLIRIAGADFGENAWSASTMARASVVSVAGVPVPPKMETLDDLDGLWDHIDGAATEAVLVWMAARQADVETHAKNSSAPLDSESVSGS